LAKTESPRSDAGILATAKKAICIPSRRPTTHEDEENNDSTHSGHLPTWWSCPRIEPRSQRRKIRGWRAIQGSGGRRRSSGLQWCLIGFNCLTGKLRHEHLDEVRRNRPENSIALNPEREDREVVVDVVEHAKRSSD
jgi:hypothetical protein